MSSRAPKPLKCPWEASISVEGWCVRPVWGSRKMKPVVWTDDEKTARYLADLHNFWLTVQDSAGEARARRVKE